MDLTKLTKISLLEKCAELNILRCKSKTKEQLIQLINGKVNNESVINESVKNESVINKEVPSDKIRFIDLFCGIGGFHQAMKRLDGVCVFASDIDENCRKTYEKNYGLKPDGDITKIKIEKIPSFDILCGGFPCQSFSNSGKKKGFSDPRGNLFENILNIAKEKHPSFMFLENVKHIKNIDNGKVFKHIMERINECGYIVNESMVFELSPHQLGVPQQRERVIFVCIRSDIYNPNINIAKSIPIPNIPIKIDEFFDTDKNYTDKYKISSEIEDVLNAWNEIISEFDVGENLSPTILCNEFYNTYSEEEFNALSDWKKDYITKNKPLYEKYKNKWDTWYNKHSTLLQKREIYSKLEWQTGKKKDGDSIFNYFIQFRQSGIRVKKSSYFPTLVAIVQTPIYAKEKRYITPKECAKLQSFPENFIMNESDHIAYKQFGNAVNVDVVHYIISNVLKLYNFNCNNNEVLIV